MAQVSIVVVNHNGSSLLEDCLTSLNDQTYTDFEVILVDNGSTDDSIMIARRLLPKICVLPLNENTGWARGNNIGIRHATGRFLVLLNNDTRADPNFLLELIRPIESNPKVGMVAPKILNYYDPRVIDSVGGLAICRDGIAQGIGRGEIDRGQYDELEEIIIPSGCAALYRKAMLDEIGLFDESFFAYCEDSDLALRGLWAGWTALSAPKAKIYHKYSVTSGFYSPTKLYLVERNHFYLVLKNFPPDMILFVPAWTLYRYLLMAIAIFTSKGKGVALKESRWPELLLALLKGLFHAFPRLWQMVGRRPKIRRISRHHFMRLIKTNRMSLSKLIFNG